MRTACMRTLALLTFNVVALEDPLYRTWCSSSLVQGCSDVGSGSGGSGSGSVEVEDANVGWSGRKRGRESITVTQYHAVTRTPSDPCAR
jgi:hypothetical protein